MSYQAIRFAGGLRNIKGNNSVPYLGLFEKVRASQATPRAKSPLMTAEPVVSARAAVYDERKGVYVFYYGDMSVSISNGHRMHKFSVNVNKH